MIAGSCSSMPVDICTTASATDGSRGFHASWDARAVALELTLPDGTVVMDGVDRGPPVLQRSTAGA